MLNSLHKKSADCNVPDFLAHLLHFVLQLFTTNAWLLEQNDRATHQPEKYWDDMCNLCNTFWR